MTKKITNLEKAVDILFKLSGCKAESCGNDKATFSIFVSHEGDDSHMNEALETLKAAKIFDIKADRFGEFDESKFDISDVPNGLNIKMNKIYNDDNRAIQLVKNQAAVLYEEQLNLYSKLGEISDGKPNLGKFTGNEKGRASGQRFSRNGGGG